MKKITKLAITSLTAIMFIGCAGGGNSPYETTKKIDKVDTTLTKNLPKLPKDTKDTICSKTKSGCDVARAMQSLPEEKRLSCEWNYCYQYSIFLDIKLGYKKANQVCKASKIKLRDIEEAVDKEKEKAGISPYSMEGLQFEKPIHNFKKLCGHTIEDLDLDEDGNPPYIFLN